MAESAREVAFKVLKDAEKNRTYSNIAVDRALSRSELLGADRGLVTAIVMGVVERKLTLDAIISSLSQNGEKTDSDARVLLRMGIYQLYFLDRIPDHAAVNETVALAPKRLRGFINAVLREFLRRRESGRLESLFPSREEDMLGYLSVKYSFPKDVCAEFIKIYGTERTEVIFEKFNSAPPLTLRINTLKISRDDYSGRLRESGIDFRLSDRLENAVLLDGVAYNELPGVDEGWFFIQDEASQICVEALGAESGETIVDVCSQSLNAYLR
jgi:16S rRNA (cytosine967-C5)-methyltransferase